MSRRKQAKPRALKRGEWDSESLQDQDMIPDSGQCDTSVTNDRHVANGAGDDANMPEEVEDGEAQDQVVDKYRCETCGVSLDSLRSFMDHRNFECVAGMEEATAAILATGAQADSVNSVAVAMETENSLESDLNGTDPPSWRSDTPDDQSLSPSSCATPTDPEVELSCTIGVTEATPYSCQFCDKAFPRLSYLKRHEQSHGDQMPFKCDFCQRLFKHKRSRDRHVKLHTGDKKYRCPHCEAAFSRSDHLKIHMKTHDNAKPFQCTTCNRGYNTAAALTSHMQNHKKGPIPPSSSPNFRCPAHLTSSKELQTHILGHGSDSSPLDKVTQCVFCPQVCVGYDALATHMDSMHPGEKATKCPVCGEGAASVDLLCQHLKEHDNSSAIIMEQQEDESPCKSPRLSCVYCTKDNFLSDEALQLHVQAMHGPLMNGELSTTSGPPPPSLSPGSLAFALSSVVPFGGNSSSTCHSTPSGNLSYSCEYCTMKFSSVQALQKHTLSVHSFTEVLAKGKELLFCSHCTMGFTSASVLSEHVKAVHSVTTRDSLHRDNRTDENSGMVTSSSNRGAGSIASPKLSPKDGTKHLSSTGSSNNSGKGGSPVSSKTQPHVSDSSSNVKVNGDIGQFTHPGTLLCNQCNAAFPDFESFRTHLKTHLDEVIQKYVCGECQGEFASEEQLDGHVVTHYLSTTTEYGCQCCLKLFSKPDELQKHLMDIHAHHLYRCSLCKEMFDSKVSIQVHFAVKHSNECRLFKCTACNSVFRSEMEFQLHVKVAHLRQAKPFRCLFCSLGFGSELELQCHLMAHKKQFACSLCDEAFHVEFLLDKHMQSKHATEAATVSSEPTEVVCTVPTSSTSLSPPATMLTDVSVSSITTPSSAKPPKSKIPTLVTAVSSSSSTPSSSTIPPLTPKKDPKCDICDAELPSDAALAQHRKQVHNIKTSGSQKGSSQQTLSLYCAYCNEACKSRTELENHMKVHTLSSSKHKCNVCDEVCPTASILAEHKLTHCKVVTGSMCVACKVGLKSEDQYYSHLQQHNAQGLPLPCVVCRQTLMSEVEVQVHAKFHLKNAEPLFPCCLCLKQLELNNLVANGVSGGLQTYVCKECFHQNGSGGSGTDADLRCGECKVKFESDLELEQHSLVHKKTYQCIKCQMSFATEQEIQMHVASHLLHEGTRHECRLCHKVLDSPAKLQCHLIEHTFEGCASYTCYMCSAVFTTASLIQQHMLEHGLNSRPYDCSRCHQKFFFRAELENHVFSHSSDHSLISTDPDPSPQPPLVPLLQCPDCLRSFSTAPALANHRKIHQPKGHNYKCSMCSDIFDSSVEMQQHYFKAHGSGCDGGGGTGGESSSSTSSSPKRQFRCNECDQEFPCLSNLQGHLRLHTPGTKFTCPECHKEFALARNLHIHMRLHSGVKPYGCPMCDKRFARKENRKAHLKAHSGARPFLCPHCGKAFSRKGHVREHMRLHAAATVASSPSDSQGTLLAAANASELCPDKSSSPSLQTLLRQAPKDSSPATNHTCRLCDSRFSLLKSLKRHIRKVHGGSGRNVKVSFVVDRPDVPAAASSDASSCSGELKDVETSDGSASLVDSEFSHGASPFTNAVVEERNNPTPQEVMACE